MRVAFAMTIHKSQGQTLSRVGVFLPLPCFSHGQLYVAASRLWATPTTSGSPSTATRNGERRTRNIVYREALTSQ